MPHGPEFKVVHGSGDSSHLLHDFVTTQCGSNIYESPFKHGNTGDRTLIVITLSHPRPAQGAE